MSYNVMLEGLITNMGGCGKFQWILSSIMHLSKTIATWSMLHMSFIGQEPKFFCESNGRYPNGTVYDTTYEGSKSCSSLNNTECIGYVFEDDMHTVVSEVSEPFFFLGGGGGGGVLPEIARYSQYYLPLSVLLLPGGGRGGVGLLYFIHHKI